MTDTLTRDRWIRINPLLIADYLAIRELRCCEPTDRNRLHISHTVLPPPIRNGEELPKYLQRILTHTAA